MYLSFRTVFVALLLTLFFDAFLTLFLTLFLALFLTLFRVFHCSLVALCLSYSFCSISRRRVTTNTSSGSGARGCGVSEDVEQAEAAGDADLDPDHEDFDCYRASLATQPGTAHPSPSVSRLPAGTSSELCKFITELKDALDWTPLKLLRANADIETLTLRGLHGSLIALAGAWWWETVLGAAIPPVVKAAQSKALAWGASLTHRLVVSDSDLWFDAPYVVSTTELHGLVPEGTMQPRLFVLMLALLGSLWNRQAVGNPCPKRAIVSNVVLS